MRRGYGRSLTIVLRHQTLTILVFLATLVGTVLLYVVVPKGFLPLQDTGQITATVDAPPSVSFASMSAFEAAADKIALADPGVAGVASFVGVGTVNATPNSGHLTIVLKPLAQRRDSVNTIIGRLAARYSQVSGFTVHMQPTQDIQIGSKPSRTQFQYTLTDIDAVELAESSAKLLARLKTLPTLTDVASDQENGGLALDLVIDRDQASRLGVLPQAIDDTLYDAFGQRQVTTIYSQVNQYHVVQEVDPSAAIDPNSLASIYVRSGNGSLVPLGAFVQARLIATPLSVTHQGQFPSVTLSFNLASGASLGNAVAAIDSARAELALPDTVVGDFSGDAAEFNSSLTDEPVLILAAVVVIYIVLGVLYESVIHPITILSTLPSAGVGALLAMMLFGQDLSLVSLIGIVLLMGIVKKNAIMMIDFALIAEREQGKAPLESIYQASLLRFRPIMMTTMAALLGALPLAFDQGTGSELRRPLGIAIVGGLLLSQLLTLYTTPVIYLWLDRLKHALGGAPAAPTSPPASSPGAAE